MQGISGKYNHSDPQ